MLAIGLQSGTGIREDTIGFVGEGEFCPGQSVVHVDYICMGARPEGLGSSQTNSVSSVLKLPYSVFVSSNPFCVFSWIWSRELKFMYVAFAP